MKTRAVIARSLRRSNLFIVFISIFCFLFFVHFAFAQTSDTVSLKVGNPPPKTGVVEAAKDIFDSYQECPPVGYALDNPSSPSDCKKKYIDRLTDESGKKKYSSQKVNSFETRRIGSLTGHPKCSQCLGFVSTALALSLNDSSALSGFENPKAIFDYGQSFTVGNPPVHYVRVRDNQPKPGDIGISGQGGDAFVAYGHILIVKSLDGKGAFIGLESNWAGYCKTRNEISHAIFYYTFYRKSE